jgi:N-acylneuraminate cytidylyltransferase
MKPIIVIPARGGSKGVPRKNIKSLNGVPLIQYTLDAAREIFNDEIICVSTDDAEIIDFVEGIGLKVPFVRPNELSLDSSGTYEVLLHSIKFYEEKGHKPDTLILLQPTSPFRNANHIKEALQLYNDKLDMVVSVKKTKVNPYYLLFEEDSDGFLKKSKEANFITRQDCPDVWEFNGAIYIINIKTLKEKPLNCFEKVIKYEMDEFSSHDIDTPLDWEIAKYIGSMISKL